MRIVPVKVLDRAAEVIEGGRFVAGDRLDEPAAGELEITIEDGVEQIVELAEVDIVAVEMMGISVVDADDEVIRLMPEGVGEIIVLL